MKKGFALLALSLCATISAAAQAETLTLGRAIGLATKRAPALAAAKAHVDAADARITRARAGYLPSLYAEANGSGSANTQTTQQANNATSFDNKQVSVGARAGVRWTLWDFGKTSSNNAAASAALEGADASQKASFANVVGDTATAYLNLLFREQLRDLEQATVHQREKTFVLSKALAKAGLQPAVEEIRSESRVEAARRDLAISESEVAGLRIELAIALSLDPTAPLQVTPPQMRGIIAEDVTAAMAEAAQNHPSLLAARSDLTDANASESAATAQYLPSVRFQGDGFINYTSIERNGQSFASPLRGIEGTVSLYVPIFDLATPSGVGAARSDVLAAKARLEQAKRRVRTEAGQAAENLKSTEAVLEHARKAADASSKVLAVMQARYAQGISSALELIEAEAADIDAKQAKIRAELSQALAAVRLLTATGKTQKLEEIQ
jgi:outer membrane protein TolC